MEFRASSSTCRCACACMDWRTASSVPPVIVAMTSTNESKNLLRSFMCPANSRSFVGLSQHSWSCFLSSTPKDWAPTYLAMDNMRFRRRGVDVSVGARMRALESLQNEILSLFVGIARRYHIARYGRTAVHLLCSCAGVHYHYWLSAHDHSFLS